MRESRPNNPVRSRLAQSRHPSTNVLVELHFGGLMAMICMSVTALVLIVWLKRLGSAPKAAG